MRATCERIFQAQHVTTKKMVITLCKNTSDRYHCNTLIFIAIVYPIYIESKLYNLEYIKVQSWSHEIE